MYLNYSQHYNRMVVQISSCVQKLYPDYGSLLELYTLSLAAYSYALLTEVFLHTLSV